MATSDRPLAIDLYCGLGGWTEALLAEGWRVIGFDIERHNYGKGAYPGALVLQDVRTLHGAQFRNADLIVASPPCQFFSRMAMPFKSPWKPAEFERRRNLGHDLFWQCWRIQHEASEAASRYIPLIVENVRGAQPWVGEARWHYGSFYLWGDVPPLMPLALRPYKVPSEQGRRTAPGNGTRFTSQDCGTDRLHADRDSEGTKQHGSGPVWWRTGNGALSSKSSARKAASAQIAKIPYPLAQHIARVFKPQRIIEASA